MVIWGSRVGTAFSDSLRGAIDDSQQGH